MSKIIERLRSRAESYRAGGPSSEHTAALLDEAALAIERWEDRSDGLEADLDSAIERLWSAGATSWVKLNYPKHFAKFSAAPSTPEAS